MPEPKINVAELFEQIVKALPESEAKAVVIAASGDVSAFASGFILITPEGMKLLDPETVRLLCGTRGSIFPFSKLSKNNPPGNSLSNI